MTTLTLPDPLLAETFAGLRECGGGRRECVQYWCASLDEPSLVTTIVHPRHRSSAFGYEVDSDWVTCFFLHLREHRETVVAQIHTHPGAATHSNVDDKFALAPATGFLSLVIPNFAMADISLVGSHLVEMQADGRWRETDPAQAIGRG